VNVNQPQPPTTLVAPGAPAAPGPAAQESALRTALQDCLAAIAPEARLDAIDPQASLRTQLDLDSYDFLQLLIALHDRLGVDVPETAYAAVDSVDGLLAFLAGRGSPPPPAQTE
jgi:acyl carrier protein